MEDAPTFMHYFNRSGQVSDSTPMPKFILYSAHAETVAPILHAFDSPLLETPQPAAMVFVNFYENSELLSLDDRFKVEITLVP